MAYYIAVVILGKTCFIQLLYQSITFLILLNTINNINIKNRIDDDSRISNKDREILQFSDDTAILSSHPVPEMTLNSGAIISICTMNWIKLYLKVLVLKAT